jgi:hypothetical protein
MSDSAASALLMTMNPFDFSANGAEIAISRQDQEGWGGHPSCKSWI